MIKTIVTLAAAIIGGLIFHRLKLPAGALFGAMIFVAVINCIIKENITFPAELKIALQIMAGAFIGLNINREFLSVLKTLVIPALVIVVSVILLNLIIGYLLYKIAGLDSATALFASAPGGIMEMILVADSLGADTVKVAILHLVRLLAVLTCIPLILSGLLRILHN